MSKETIANVLETLRTKEDAEMLEESLGEIEARLFTKSHDAASLLKGVKLNARTSDALRNILLQEEGSTDQIMDAHSMFAALKAEIPKLPVVRVELAVDPDPGLVDEVSSWVRSNVSLKALVDVGVDRRMLGGARIIFNGRYREMTLAELINKVLESERQIVLQQLVFGKK